MLVASYVPADPRGEFAYLERILNDVESGRPPATLLLVVVQDRLRVARRFSRRFLLHGGLCERERFDTHTIEGLGVSGARFQLSRVNKNRGEVLLATYQPHGIFYTGHKTASLCPPCKDAAMSNHRPVTNTVNSTLCLDQRPLTSV